MRPMFATPGGLPEGPQWRYEVMWNGLRVLADATGGTLRLTSCSGHDATGRFPEIAELADRADDGLRVDAAGSVALSPVYDDGRALLSAARRQHLAGVVAKRRDAPYRPGGRDPSWIEVRPAGHVPAAAARAWTRSVRSQGTSRSSRPKCP